MIDKRIYRAALVLVVLAYWWSAIHFSLNLPKGDDYFDVLHFLNEYRSAGNWWEKFRLILSQTNDHRTAFGHLVYLGTCALFGEIDFRLLIFVGSLGCMGITALFAWQFRETPALPLTAFIAAYMLNFQYWGSMFSPMASIANFWVLLLGFLSISLLFHTAKWAFAAACLAGVLASFSQGNGLLIWPFGFLCLLHRNRFRPGSAQQVLWCLLAIAVVAAFFWGFSPHDEGGATGLTGLDRGRAAWRVAVWFLSFLGAALVFDSQSIPLAVLCGVSVLALSAWSFLFFLPRKPAMAYAILFLVAGALVAAVGRSMFDFSSALSPRYKIYSICLSVLGFVALQLRFRNARFGGAIQAGLMAFAVVQCIAGYTFGIPALQREQLNTVDAMRRWLLTQDKRHLDFFLRPGVEQQLRTAIETKLWNPRAVFPDMLVFSRQRSATPCGGSREVAHLPYTWRRTQGALVGELQFLDGALWFDYFANIVVCVGERTYAAPVVNITRRHDGVLILHYLLLDRVEKADALFVEGASGTYYRADFRPADTFGRN
jgi:hypothetical protein